MKKNQFGISLIEILVGLTVTAIAGFLIIGLTVSSNNIFYKQSIQVSQGLSINQATLEITDLIKSSAGVVTQYPVSGNPQFSTSGNTLVLKIPSINSSGQVIDSVFDYAVITQDSTNSKILRKKLYPGAGSARKSEDKVLSTAVGSLTFNFLDNTNSVVTPSQSVRINFIINLSDKTGLSTNESSGSGTVNIKNI